MQTMAEEEIGRLELEHIFPSREIVWLRAAKEANLRGIYVNVMSSSVFHLQVHGGQEEGLPRPLPVGLGWGGEKVGQTFSKTVQQMQYDI